MKVLIIGNGPSALAKKLDVDSFDGQIVRFNNYTTKGYEPYVGRRTDAWVVNSSQYPIKDEHKKRWFFSYRDDLTTRTQCTQIGAEWIPERYVQLTRQRMAVSAISLGAITTTMHLEQGYEVWIMGFTFLNPLQEHHYNKDGATRGETHKHEAEWLYFNELLESGKIKWFGQGAGESMPIMRIPVKCGTDKDLAWYRQPAHNAWYRWFGSQSEGKTILDVGSGMGKGLEILSEYATAVIGYENDSRLVGLYPRLIIAESLDVFADKSIDCITCVDVIEHVVEDLTLFNHLRRIARESIFITTPCYTRSKCGNIAHCREYTIPQFWNIFKPDELWSAAPDGSAHRTLLLEKLGDYVIDHSPEWVENVRPAKELKAYKGHIPLNVKFNNTVDAKEWPHICGIWRQ